MLAAVIEWNLVHHEHQQGSVHFQNMLTSMESQLAIAERMGLGTLLKDSRSYPYLHKSLCECLSEEVRELMRKYRLPSFHWGAVS